jgi:hypothetical protein
MKNILGPIGQEFLTHIHDGEEWALWTGCDPNAERWAIRFDSREETYQVLHGLDHDPVTVRGTTYEHSIRIHYPLTGLHR